MLGVEGTVTQEWGGHRLTAQAAVFGDNDTSGTLLTYRGWALDGTRATLGGIRGARIFRRDETSRRHELGIKAAAR